MSKLAFAAADLADARFAGFGYELSFCYCGQMLTLISTPKDAKEADVLAFAEAAHREMYLRICDEVRLARANERPGSWQVNPQPLLQGEVWMLVVNWRLYAFLHEGGCDE